MDASYEGALMSEGSAPQAARAFIQFLASEDARPHWLAQARSRRAIRTTVSGCGAARRATLQYGAILVDASPCRCSDRPKHRAARAARQAGPQRIMSAAHAIVQVGCVACARPYCVAPGHRDRDHTPRLRGRFHASAAAADATQASAKKIAIPLTERSSNAANMRGMLSR